MQKTQSVRMNFLSRINALGSGNKIAIYCVLLGIISYELMKINFQIIFKELNGNTILYDNSWVASSIVGSTVLGFLSDRFLKFSWRKPIVLFGLFFSLISSFTFLIPNISKIMNQWSFILIIIINGTAGCYIGAIRAFYLDKFSDKKIRHFAITVIFQCLTWMITGFLFEKELLTSEIMLYAAPACTSLSLLMILFFTKDERKAEPESTHPKLEIKILGEKYNHSRNWSILVPFLFLAAAYQLMPYIGEYTFSESKLYLEIFNLGLGVGLGVFIAYFFLNRISVHKALKIVYLVSIFFFIVAKFLDWIKLFIFYENLQIYFVLFAVLGGIIWIITVKDFLAEADYSEDGLILGFIESIQSLGELIGTFISTTLSATIVLRKSVPIWPFILLLSISFIFCYLYNIVNYFQKKSKY